MVCALGDHTELALSEVSAKPPALSGRARLKSQEEAVSGRYDGVPQLLSSTHTGKAGGCRAYTVKCLQRKATGYMVVQDFRSASTRPCSAEYLSAHRQPSGKHIWTSGGPVVKNLPANANAGNTGSIPVQEDSIHHEQLSPSATIPEPVCPGASAPQQEKPPQREASALTARKKSPCSQQLEEARMQQ